MRCIRNFVVGFFAVVGFVFVALTGLGIYAALQWVGPQKAKPAPDRFILSMNLDKGFDEAPRTKGLSAFKFKHGTSFEDVVLALKRAKDDPRVVAVAATLSDRNMGMARVQEIRDLVGQIREAGKPTMLFSDSIGEGTGALLGFYLASSFEDIWVQPSGTVGIAGIGIEQPFLKGFLDRLGLKVSVVKRKEYKTAAESLTDDSMSAANRQSLEALLGGWYAQIVSGISTDRNLSTGAVKTLIDKGPLTAAEAKDAGLIDHLGYRDEFMAALPDVPSNARVFLSRYVGMEPPPDQQEPKKTIAVVTAVGAITRGSDDDSPFGGAEGIKSEITAKAIRDAVKDKDVAAILLRVDSPGGSYVASDTIWHEIMRAKERKKPVIVSMGDVAASGGYFISMAADRIFAGPGTITGSIGVLSGKLVIGGASEKLDIHWDRVAFGKSATHFSPTQDFTLQERERMNQVMDVIYADFTTKAAQGRGMTVGELEKAARGRVWGGVDALKMGLVDEMGGFAQALDYTKTAIGLTPEDTVWLVPYPAREDPWEKVLKALRDGELPMDILTAIKTLVQLGAGLDSVQDIFAQTRAQGPQLRMEPIAVK